MSCGTTAMAARKLSWVTRATFAVRSQALDILLRRGGMQEPELSRAARCSLAPTLLHQTDSRRRDTAVGIGADQGRSTARACSDQHKRIAILPTGRLLPDDRPRSIGKGKIVSFYLSLVCLPGEGREIGRRRGFSARS